MNSILNKRISFNFSVDIKAILIMLLVGVFCVTAVFATPVLASQLQVTIASHFTVRYNGAVQHMRDANGNTIHPLVINGTTYLPLRAAADMFGVPVSWVGETNTIELGNAGGTGTTGSATPAVQGVRLRDVSRVMNVRGQGADWINDTSVLPRRTDDRGNSIRTYTEGIRIPISGSSATSIRWEGSFTHLSFDIGAIGDSGASVRIASGTASGSLVLWEQTIAPGEIITLSDLDVSEFGNDSLWFIIDSANRGEIVWILDPVLR